MVYIIRVKVACMWLVVAAPASLRLVIWFEAFGKGYACEI
jgi:hypothetical protein